MALHGFLYCIVLCFYPRCLPYQVERWQQQRRCISDEKVEQVGITMSKLPIMNSLQSPVIEGYTARGFNINGNRVFGSVALLPRAYFHWKVCLKNVVCGVYVCTCVHVSMQSKAYDSLAEHSYCCPVNQHWDACAPLRRVQANPPGAGLVTHMKAISWRKVAEPKVPQQPHHH